VTAKEVREAVVWLNDRYMETNASFRIQEIAGGYQFYTLPAYVDIVQRLVKGTGEVRLSQAGLEVLSIVAYKQPVIRADVEAIRGVACGPMLRHLMDCKLVKITGRSEQLGRPLLYGTTKKFLQHFGLKDTKDLPKIGSKTEAE
jgi:segregation and condensation protein B